MLDFDEDSCIERNALRESRKERRGAVAARSEGNFCMFSFLLLAKIIDHSALSYI